MNFYFDGLLGLIQSFGEQLSLYNRYEKHFAELDDFRCALCDTYMDSLIFLRQARSVYLHVIGSTGFRVTALLKNGIMWLGRVWQNFEGQFSDILNRLTRRFDYLGHIVTFLHRDRLHTDLHNQLIFRTEVTNTLGQIAKATPAETGEWRECRRQSDILPNYVFFYIEHRRREAIFAWLSPVDSSQDLVRHGQKCAPNTCQWLLNAEFFRSWRDDACPHGRERVRWLYGNAGTGKTVMSAVIVNHLERLATLQRKEGSVAYFFDKSDEGKNASIAMYRTLIHQLFSQSMSSSSSIETAFQAAKIYGRLRFSSADGPVPLLRGILNGLTATTYIVIDALDECQDMDEALTPLVDAIQSSTNCRALFLSRDVPPIREAISGYQSMRIASESTKPDVDMYLSSAVQHLTVPITDTELRHEVVLRLSRGADGMFLWAHLMVQQLNTATSPADVRDMITGPPRGLYALYRHVLQGLDSEPKQWRNLKSNIISRVMCSPRPLSWIELQISLSLGIREEENLPLDCYRRRPYQSLVLKLCQPFVEYHTETDCFRPAHLSVIQFMSSQNESEDAPGMRPSLSAEHQKIAKLCLNYVDFAGIHSVVSVDADEFPLEKYATAYWCHHLINAEPDTELYTKATNFLASEKKRRVWLTRLLLRNGELLPLEQVFELLRQARSWLKRAISEETKVHANSMSWKTWLRF